MSQPGLARALVAGMLVMAAGLASCTLLPPARPLDDYIGPSPTPGCPAPQPATMPAVQPPASQPTVAPAGPAEPATSAAEPASSQPGPLALTVEQAILLALEQNQALRVQRLEPAIARTFEQENMAEFDPVVQAAVSGLRQRARQDSGGRLTTNDALADVAILESLPTGTDISVEARGELSGSDLRDDQYVTRLGLTVNQALLQGAGLDVNLATVRQARLDTLASEYELRGFAQTLVADTEQAYWDYALTQRAIEIVTDSMALAQQQVEETTERVRVGVLAETELAAAEAELARRRENLINARGAEAIARLRLLRLLNPRREDFWKSGIVLLSVPSVPPVRLDDVEAYVAVAMRMRPELNQSRLGIQREDLELVRTRDGLLPRLDLFITLGKTGYAESFGRSYGDLSRDGYDAQVGLRFAYPPANRAARARQERVTYTRERAMRALENVEQLAQVDVRTAYIEVERTAEQVTATAATRRFQDQTLRAETEKFRVGKSTNLLVAQAQRDLLQAQISEVAAVVAHLRALIQLHLQQGALLERRGIAAPGACPVDLSRQAWR